MAEKDKLKWDKKYKENYDLLNLRPPSAMVVDYSSMCSGKLALDLACGAGRNSLYLLEQGFSVDAIDISTIAIDSLKSRANSSNLNVIVADLDEYELIRNRYDLIVKTNFLDRELIKRAKEALKSGGVMVVETYMEDADNEKKDSNPNFLLKKDELLDMFKEGFEVLEYKTFWNESFEKYRMKKASIAVRKL